MTVCEPHDSLPSLVQRFFADWLIAQRDVSPHTVASYRDTFRLLLAYASRQLTREPTDLSVTDIDADLVAGFLTFVEDDRKNSIRTRNVRRAAIRGFFRFVAIREPALLLHCQRVLAIPAKRQSRRTVDVLDREEVAALLAMPDLSTSIGRRDRNLLLVALQTGLRRSERRRRGPRSPMPAAYPVPWQRPQGTGDAATRRQRQGTGSVAPGTGRGPAGTLVREQSQAALQPGWNRTDRAEVHPAGIRNLPVVGVQAGQSAHVAAHRRHGTAPERSRMYGHRPVAWP